MAQKVQITLLCDLDDGNVEAEETLHFSLADTTYEVDVCGEHAQQIRDGLQPFVAHARKISLASSTRRRPGRPAAAATNTGWHPRLGQGPGHPGQRPRPHPRLRGEGVRGSSLADDQPPAKAQTA